MKPNQQKNPLKRWLSLNWERPERSHNPDVRDFWVNLLDYPKDQVVTEDKAGGGYPDFKFLTDEKIPWVVGDLKKDDRYLTTETGRETLWTEKRKYVEGLTRYLVFLTANYLWVILPTGETIEGLEAPIDLSATNLDHLRETLYFLSHRQAKHSRQWEIFLTGEIAYSYLKLDDNTTLEQLKKDLRSSFAELNESSDRALKLLFAQYQDYHQQEAEIKRNLVGTGESQRRALIKLKNEFQLARSIFDEILPTFEEQYGREVNTNSNQQAKKKIQEAFISDSVAVLIARVLFLRLLEDLNLVKKRRLSNGGLKDWAEFVENLTGDASALVRLVGEDLGKIYQEPFARNLFDWLYQTHENINPPLQRLILRLNAYDFSGLSEEILGDIYQSFLPPAKRKQLGEFYTPASIVNWLLDQTVFSH
ncbi:type I restriction-modification system subunit M [Dactylococcopsis salina]|uniref:site-specific DNA-methyltransferase (adenine-specific) n=1 Tax=Dactylococcopsis salina (strain PCC 8305) TaxID=13035 RepID=K9Z021_DACS8|nr:type I restriction-modification system subunit M [Dactylococcopsis salina]AFZ52082.1 hypothetical protein Dacsa_3602 [Dactylococcopsis salina PCC 8305]